MEGIADQNHRARRVWSVVLSLVFVSLSSVAVRVRQPQEFLKHKKAEETRDYPQSNLPRSVVRHRFWKETDECRAEKCADSVSEQNHL
jgi:hypothetical protein